MFKNETLSGLEPHTILDLIPAALFIIDENTMILDYNISASKLTGKEIGKHNKRLCGDILQCVHA